MSCTSEALAVLKARVMALETELDTLRGTSATQKEVKDSGVEL